MDNRNPHYNQIDDERLQHSQYQSRGMMLFITLNSIGDAVLTTDETGLVTFLNPVALALTGWGLTDAIGTKVEEVFTLIDENTKNDLPNPSRQALETKAKVNLPPNAILVRKNGDLIPVEDSCAPIQGERGKILGTILVFRDISERKETETMLRYQAHLDRTIAQISTTFATAGLEELDAIIDGALQEVCFHFQGVSAQVFEYNESSSKITCTHEWAAEGVAPLLGKSTPLRLCPKWIEEIRNQQTFYVLSVEDMPIPSAAKRALSKRRGVKSVAAVPISQGSQAIGFVAVNSTEEKQSWSEDQLGMISIIANLCSSAVSRQRNANALDAAQNRVVEIGARIQQKLLFSLPPNNIPGFEIATLAIPSKGVDGDFYDFLHHPQRGLDVLMGDVMGKGVPAALLAAGAKTEFLRSISHLLVGAPRGTMPSPREIVHDVHKVLTPQLIALESFATLSYVRFDLVSRNIIMVDCGSTYLIKYDGASGKITYHTGHNLPLGMSEHEQFLETKVDYAPGDLFVLYSDGVTEARNSRGEFFGLERLHDIIAVSKNETAKTLTRQIKEAVVEFKESDSFSDDLTCIVIKISASPSEDFVSDEEEICISSRLDQLGTIRMFFREYCNHTAGIDLTGHDRGLIELALTEVASNIIRHAYHGSTDKRITLRIYRTADSLRLRLTHTGEKFDGVSSIPLPSLEGPKEGGLGLFIIDQTLDRVIYGQEKTGTQYIELMKITKQSK